METPDMDLALETLAIIADSAGNLAAPAASAESAARDLRRELADAISDREAADRAVRIAADISARANHARDEAAADVGRLKQGLDRTQAAATEAHSQACIAALRRGEEPPACLVLPEIDTTSYAAAMAHLAALDRAASELSAEYDRAAHAAGAAAARVSSLVDEILFANIYVLADEAVAAIQLHWRLVDKLKGLIMLDERRGGGPRFRAFQEAFLGRIDRQKAAIVRNPVMIERGRYHDLLAGLAADEEAKWQDYRRRLASDPTATFDLDGGRA